MQPLLALTTELPQVPMPKFSDQHPNREQAGTYFTESINLTILEMEFSPSSAIGVQLGQGRALLLAYPNLSHPTTLFTALVGIGHEFTPHDPLWSEYFC